jgi:histone H1/5
MPESECRWRHVHSSRYTKAKTRSGQIHFNPLVVCEHCEKMADTTVASTSTPAAGAEKPATPKKASKASKTKKPRTAPSHPKTSDMVNAAITNLKERGGSSLQAIKKYVAATYKVDVEKLSPFIKKYLKSAVASGALVQTKGKGASGSFKLNATASGKGEKKKLAAGEKKKKVAKKPKTAAAKTAKKSGEKKTKPKSPKKKKAAPKKAAASAEKKKPAKPKKAKTPKKEKKAKAPKKPKSPKPKKAAAKKAAPKK